MKVSEFETELTHHRLKNIILRSYGIDPDMVIESHFEITPENTVVVRAQVYHKNNDETVYFVEV